MEFRDLTKRPARQLRFRPTDLFHHAGGYFGRHGAFDHGALNRIPQDLFDSGKLDGIGLFREFFYLALPLSWSTVGIMWVMSFAGGWAAYNDVMLLTGGSYNTTNLGYFLVSHTLSATSGSGENFNYPAAIGLLMTGVIAPLTLVLRWLAEKLVSPVDF